MRKVRTLPGDSACRILFRNFGRDDDDLEEAFWRVNPKLPMRGVTLPSGVLVTLPEITGHKKERVVTPWD